MNEVGYPNFAIENFKRTSSIPISNTPKPKTSNVLAQYLFLIHQNRKSETEKILSVAEIYFH